MKKITMNGKQEHLFGECIVEFLNKCKIKNLTENSINSYKNKFNVIVKFIEPDTDIKEIDNGIVDDLIIWLQKYHTTNAATINSYLRALRALLNYCHERGWIRRVKVHLLKQPEVLKETYTNEELKKLLKKPDKQKCDFVEFRTWALENYLIGTGNRIGSAIEIKIKDVDLYNETVILRKTKNRKQQVVPLTSSLISVLQEYMDVRGGSPNDYLFCNAYGNKCCLTSIQQTVARYNKKRGVIKTSCHLFRHSFATMYLRNGGDIYRLQKLLGHGSVKVTENYLHMVPDDLRIDYDKINPLESLTMNEKRIKIK